MSEVLLVVRASPARLAVGAILQGVLGALLLWIALAHPPAALGWRAFLLVGGGLVLWNAVSLWKSGQLTIELTSEVLRDSRGAVIARIDQIEKVSRGPFALKPARGFGLRLAAPAGNVWMPGIWWRVGRFVGVGGVTSAAETRIMAEMIEAMLAAGPYARPKA